MTPEQRADKVLESWRACNAGLRPPSFGVMAFDIAAAIREAVDAEREACAREAESKCRAWADEGDGESVIASQSLYGMADAGRLIACAIRARSATLQLPDAKELERLRKALEDVLLAVDDNRGRPDFSLSLVRAIALGALGRP